MHHKRAASADICPQLDGETRNRESRMGKEGTMVMRSPWSDASSACTSSAGCTDGVELAVCSCPWTPLRQSLWGSPCGRCPPGGPDQGQRSRVPPPFPMRSPAGGTLAHGKSHPLSSRFVCGVLLLTALWPEKTTAAHIPRQYAVPRHDTRRSCRPTGAWRQQPAAATWRAPPGLGRHRVLLPYTP